MRYAQGGGFTAQEQQHRERLRLEAAERFERGDSNRLIAADLRLTVRSVERWQQAWRLGGSAGLGSKGPQSLPRLSERQFAQLERVLEKGLLAHGWADQGWTLARIKTLIGRRFHVSYTDQGVWKLLRRNGWSCRQPVRRAIERDEGADEVWKKQVWPRVKAWWRRSGPGWCSRTGPGSRWHRLGPVPGGAAVTRLPSECVDVLADGSRLPALTCSKVGERSRLVYRPRPDDGQGRSKGRKSFAWTDYRDLIVAAHQRLDGPVMLL